MRVVHISAICLVLLASCHAANAASLPYHAHASTYTVQLTPGEERNVTFAFQNIGSRSWIGFRNKTALYLYGNSSLLHHASWLADDVPAVINEKKVKPGQRATATFRIKAPVTHGTYRERFLLSYSPNQWIKGSIAALTVIVRRTPATADLPAGKPDTQHQTLAQTPVHFDSNRAELIDRGGIEWQLDPLDHTTVTLAFKNTGISSWIRDGKTLLFLSPASGKSPFKDSSWKGETRAAFLKEATVKPGEIGHFDLQIRAPNQPGKYTESFRLGVGSAASFANDAAWITGSTVTLPIFVTTPREYIAKGIVNGVDLAVVDGNGIARGQYKGVLLLRSLQEATLLGNGRLTFTYGFKNIGSAAWSTMALRPTGVRPAPLGKLASVRDESWLSANEAVRSAKATLPGEIGFIGLTIKAPPKKGTYTASFQLVADEQIVDEATIDIPITVTADGYIEPEMPILKPAISTTQISNPQPALNPMPLTGEAASLPDEPLIRVGLFATIDNQIIVRSVSQGFTLTEGGNVICRFEAGERVTVSYDRGSNVSRALGPRCTSQTTGVYAAAALDGISPLELVDFSRPVSWLPGANDNTFRGKLELRYAKATDSVWVINELPIEWYLKGIAETSNSSPQEYQRALLTAARTYAMYHVQRGTKHADEHYTVDAKYDQVYRGYGAEARDPNVVAAVDATRGQIVTFDGKLAITPYYSRSDGRTRSWTEVWGGGPYAWLVSVPVPWDQGRILWGHGVGLSATGALGMAKDGKTYDQILKHFYTGVELRRAYK